MRIAELGLVAAALLVSSPAAAYCRTTTCQFDECRPSAECDSCLEGGRALFWPTRCVSFAVDRSGSTKHGIDAEMSEATIGDAFAQWMAADCGGSRPSLGVLDLGAVSCDGATGYAHGGANLNLWRFRDGSWSHGGGGSMLALTTVTYDVDTGEILDADVEIDSFEHAITVGDSAVAYDLSAIVTHEAGHFLGLAHSCERGATMFPSYVRGSAGMRTLTGDDAAAICETFPPGIKKPCAPAPRGGAACTGDEDRNDAAPILASCALESRSSDPIGAIAFLLVALASLRRRQRAFE